MTNFPAPSLDKVVNPHLARMALHGAETFGEFRLIVRLAKPKKHPRYMKVTGLISPDEIKARVPCNQIERVSRDSNVISIEVREHIM